MNLRVNLIQPTELRYQGAVSRSFLLRATLITLASLAGIAAMLFILQMNATRQTLTRSRERWLQIEPVFKNIQAMQEELVHDRALQKELGGWSRSRLDWYLPLLEIQRLVPSNIQLIRMNVWSSLALDKSKKLPAKAAAEPEIMPVRTFKVGIDGRAVGEAGNEAVVQFVSTIKEAGWLSNVFETVNLQGVRREVERSSKTEGAIPSWEFSIEAMCAPRVMK